LDFESKTLCTEELRKKADENLLRHMQVFGESQRHPLDIFERGEGCYLYDTEGKEYLDFFSSLICMELGYTHQDELAEAASEQIKELGYHPIWGTAHPRAIELASVVADLAPEHMNHVFFTLGGGNSIETALKMAVQYFNNRGEHRWKAIARDTAWHGTNLGALGFMGMTMMRTPFEHLIPPVLRVHNASRLNRPAGESDAELTAFLLEELEFRIKSEGPETIAMVLMEPVQFHGGCIVPPEGYSEGVREICDRYGILLVSDETITGWGRCGEWFASERYNTQPDMITTAKGITSSYAPLGALILSDKVYDGLNVPGNMILDGTTFSGHPVSCAVALKNIEIMKNLDLPGHVRANEDALRAVLDRLSERFTFIKMVSGAGYLFATHLQTSYPDGTAFTESEIADYFGPERTADKFLEEGVYMRLGFDNGEPTFVFSPPLIATQEEFDVLEQAMIRVIQPLEDLYQAGPRTN
jgi:adenosylmethionine-8-amino-7-oxononanoate aminotransferase